MNYLSLLSAMLATAFLIGGLYCLTRSRKSNLNFYSFLVLLCLSWWSFCNAFFFSSQSDAELWHWHHLASIGWTGFIACTTYYFAILTGLHVKMQKLWIRVAFYALPLVLTVHNLFGRTTSLATGFTRSQIGGQWAYVNSADNVWLWIYLGCLGLYFGFSFYLLLKWSSKVKHHLKRHMAVSFVVLDALTILFGFITDVYYPLTNQALPAIANLCSACFGAGYFVIILRYDLFNLGALVSNRDIIENSTNSIVITDETGEVLFCNRAGAEMFEIDKKDIIGKNLPEYFDYEDEKEEIRRMTRKQSGADSVEATAHTEENNEKKLLVSTSVIRDKQQEYLGTVVSLRDITQISILKEQYKIKSDEYQKLAFVDTLTGLPNRRKTFEMLSERADEYDLSKEDFFVLYMDLDCFKAVNDQYGHDVGDRFLKEIADRLRSCLDEGLFFLGRLSGDEFLMIGTPDGTDESGDAYTSRVKRRFEDEIEVGEYNIKSNISVGYARYSDFENIDAMVHHADEKMYTAKQRSHTRTRCSIISGGDMELLSERAE